MNDAEIQIQFPRPGNWQEFTLTPIYRDKSGYRPPARYTADEIPAEQAPAMARRSCRAGGTGGTVAGVPGLGAAQLGITVFAW